MLQGNIRNLLLIFKFFKICEWFAFINIRGVDIWFSYIICQSGYPYPVSKCLGLSSGFCPDSNVLLMWTLRSSWVPATHMDTCVVQFYVVTHVLYNETTILRDFNILKPSIDQLFEIWKCLRIVWGEFFQSIPA